MAPDISVIIVSWNARDFLVGCLKSIQETMTDLRYEVIVVDNASSDGSPEAVLTGFPDVRLIQTGKNLGFSKGNNIGMTESRGRYYFLINSDVVLRPGCAQRLLAFMQKNPRTGLAGPRLFNGDGSYQPSCRKMPNLHRHIARALFVNSSLVDNGYRQQASKRVEVLAGSFWVARREAVDVVGKLDEQFFFYGEDVDWCLRFGKAGWQINYVTDAEAIHYGGSSTSRDTARFSVQLHKAALQFWKKHYAPPAVGIYLAFAVIHNLLRLIIYLIVSIVPWRFRVEANKKAKMHVETIRWFLSGTH